MGQDVGQARPAGRLTGVHLSFGLVVVFGGPLFVAARVAVQELDPLWTGGLRYAPAAALLAMYAVLVGLPWPRGPALKGALLSGAFIFGGAIALMHYAMVEVSAGLASVFASLVPLLTLLFASMHGLEPITRRGIVGAFVVIGGIVVIVWEQIALTTSVPHLVAAALMPAAVAEATVILKRYPPAHPVTTSAVAMAFGALILMGLSLARGESWASPTEGRTVGAVTYLILVSILVFLLFLVVVRGLAVSAASYIHVLIPITAIGAGVALAGESLSSTFTVGAGLVLIGVYYGIRRRTPPPTKGDTARDASPADAAPAPASPRP